jgi:hypothetical protein
LCPMLQTAAQTQKKFLLQTYMMYCSTNHTPTAIYTSKHSVLMTVCHSCSHDSNRNSTAKMTCNGYHGNTHFIFTFDSFHYYVLYGSFFKLSIFFFFLSISQNFCSCCSKYK